MRKNMLKEKIRNGESAIGTFVKLTDPAVPELLALAGFDFFVLDTEHVAVDREQLTNIVRAADAAGITPNVDTPEQARNLVSYVKYTPLGVRGLSPSVRACDYGTCGVQEYIDTANANTMIVSHCESKTCVENLDEVLKVDGIDVIFIGPMDLSQSYGVPGKTTDPEVKAAIDTITAKTLAAGKAVGTTAASAEAAKALMAKGVQYILLSSDEGIIVKWGKETISRIRG